VDIEGVAYYILNRDGTLIHCMPACGTPCNHVLTLSAAGLGVGAGGMAYLDSFGWAEANPSFCFPADLGPYEPK
jgi:hypothetical protein